MFFVFKIFRDEISNSQTHSLRFRNGYGLDIVWWKSDNSFYFQLLKNKFKAKVLVVIRSKNEPERFTFLTRKTSFKAILKKDILGSRIFLGSTSKPIPINLIKRSDFKKETSWSVSVKR